jgi:hypothetical protein
LRNKHLIEPLNKHEWAVVARGYNGSGYAANRYDTRLADAYKRQVRKLALPAPDTAHPAPGMAADEIKAVQKKLRALGYAGCRQSRRRGRRQIRRRAGAIPETRGLAGFRPL